MKHLSHLVLGVVLALPFGVAHAEEDRENVWRLFVADRNEPLMHVLDAGSGKTIESFQLQSQGRLYSSASGRTVFAVQADGNVATGYASGIAADDHGDHADLDVSAPTPLDVSISGERPVHFVAHHGEIAVFFDGEGVARVVREADLLEGKGALRTVETAAPHHGVAIPLGGHDVVSVPHPEDPSQLPVGVRVVDATGAPVGEMAECPGLHGEAASGNLVAIACDTGLLVLREKGGSPEITHLPYGEDLPEDGKVSTLVGGRGLQYFLGNFGASAVVLIDPQEDDAFRLIDLPLRRVHFAVDPVRAKFAYVVTEDGRLYQIDVLAGEITRSVVVTEPYSMDGHWNDPRPRIAVADDEVMVTDPLKGIVHALDTATLEKRREITVGGAPYEIVAVGASGAVHD